jgi:hypothetical protein
MSAQVPFSRFNRALVEIPDSIAPSALVAVVCTYLGLADSA